MAIAGKLRALARRILAFDSTSRGHALVTRKVADVFSAGEVKEPARIIQGRARNRMRFEIAEGPRTLLETGRDDPKTSVAAPNPCRLDWDGTRT